MSFRLNYRLEFFKWLKNDLNRFIKNKISQLLYVLKVFLMGGQSSLFFMEVNMQHIVNWNLYYELTKKRKEDMTPEEWDFYSWMYHIEEVQAGLDGDW